MREALYGFTSIAAKEFMHMRRDRTTIIFAVLLPILQLVLLGYAINFDVRHVKTTVVDLDKSRESRTFIAGLQNTQYLDVVSYLPDPVLAEQALRRNDARAAIIIPSGFARHYGTKQPPMVRILLDGSDSQVAGAARSALLRPIDVMSPNAVDIRLNVLFNPQMRTLVYTIPALVAVLLQMLTISLTSFSLVRERELGTLDQLMVSPVGRLGLMLGKMAPYSVLAMGELAFVLMMGHLIFDIQINGSIFLLMALAVPFILSALAMGLVISTVAQNQSQALQFTGLTNLPSILLSGYIAPRETLPVPLYMISNIFPVTHFIQIIRGIVVRGAGLADLIPSTFWLLFLTVVLIGAATLRFRKSTA